MLKVFTFFLIFILFYTNTFSQCLNDVIDVEFQNNLAIIGQDEVIYVSQGDLWVTIGSNTGFKFLLYKNNILTSPGQIYFAIGDEVKIIPNNPETANLEIISDEPGCNNWVEDNTATLPLP